MQPIPEKKDDVKSFFIFLFIFLIISFAIISYFYLKKNDKLPEILKPKEENKQYHEQFYTIELKSDVNNMAYELRYKQNKTMVAYGIYHLGIKEKYEMCEWNVSYELIGRHNEYYYNKIDFLMTQNQTINLSLKKKGNFTAIIINNFLRISDLNQGILQDPLICLAWDYRIYTIRINELQQVNIPNRLKSKADICYSNGGDLVSDKEYTVSYKKIVDELSEIKIYLVDKEVDTSEIPTYEQDTGVTDVEIQRMI